MDIFHTLRQKLIFYLLLCSTVPTIAITILIIFVGNRIVKDYVSNELYELAILLEVDINRFLEDGKRTATSLASEKYIWENLELFDKGGLYLRSTQQELCDYLNNRCNLYGGVLSATILDKKGIVVASSDKTGLGEDISSISYYKTVKDGALVSDVYFSEEYQRGVIDFIAPIFGKRDSVFLGLLVIKMDKSGLDRITMGKPSPNREKDNLNTRVVHSDSKSGLDLQKVIRKGVTREAYLVNKEKQMLTASRFINETFLTQCVNTEAVVYSLSNKEPFSGIYKDYRGEWVLGSSRFIQDTGWVLLVETDLYEAFHPIKRLRLIVLIILIGNIGGIVIFTSVVVLRTFGYIPLVEKVIKDVSRGNLHTHLESYKGAEFKKLAISFDEMTLALKQSRDTLRNLFDAVNDPIFLLKEGGKIADINKRVTEAFGYEMDELIECNFTSIFRLNNIPLMKQAIEYTWKLPPGKKYPTLEVFVATKHNKEIICELDLHRTAYGVQSHFRDVTETRRFEGVLEGKNKDLEDTLKALKETQAQLIQSGKLAGIGTLASGVAHEINNPLTAVMGHAMRLLRKADEGELRGIKALDPFRTELKIIIDASLLCKKITEGLTKFSRTSLNEKIEQFNLNKIIDEILILVENNLKQNNIKLIKQYDNNLKHTMGNPNQLQQVFLNIITNAAHAMPKGGTLIIATRDRDNKYVEVELADTGCGIREEHLSKIFDPFFTTKEPGRGTGLGLYISFTIIKQHNGWIDVKSTVGKGTSIFVILPVFTPDNKMRSNEI